MEVASSTHPETDVPSPPWHAVPHLDRGHGGLLVMDSWSTHLLVVDPWSKKEIQRVVVSSTQ
ncbi:hypothetical protein BDA96_03G142200 [Sorghum bicolor]|jgi:hypothetical protein|uniref:Uncharacterized protein n=1 Tax=Sorghum bicolor TaxID=4558 RepID=A0A921UM83_SORBI|nr:hypothetical protein BDA96_03G142200 [Sorghum bicolor]